MLKKLFSGILCLLVFVLLHTVAPNASAVENPKDTDNNKVGIHIIDENDLDDAASLVNSQGGDWGYVTLVVRQDERNIARMQRTLDKMRRLRLIPIIRIATKQTEEYWEKPSTADIDNWVYFLNSLNWVTKNRYVMIGNEPNHAKEWGGEINPGEYAHYLAEFSDRLKDASSEFFVLPAGFDASAPNDKKHMDEEAFLREMKLAKGDVFEKIDGLSSHSYPNPGFSGSAEGVGRGSVRTYEWELDLIKQLGAKSDLPVFITETGWVHDMQNAALQKSEEEVGKELVKAYETVWNDSRVIAVTPFVLNYQAPPFDNFSWKKRDGSFYQFYYDVQKIAKKAGKPVQKHSGEILAAFTPEIIQKNQAFYGLALVKNTGQSIWKRGEVMIIDSSDTNYEIESPFMFDIEPNENGFIFYRGVIKDVVQGTVLRLHLSVNGETISQPFLAYFGSNSDDKRLSFYTNFLGISRNIFASEISASF